MKLDKTITINGKPYRFFVAAAFIADSTQYNWDAAVVQPAKIFVPEFDGSGIGSTHSIFLGQPDGQTIDEIMESFKAAILAAFQQPGAVAE